MKRKAQSEWETTAPPQKCIRCNTNYTFGESRLCRECFDQNRVLCSSCKTPTAFPDDKGRCEDCQPVKLTINDTSPACPGCAYCGTQDMWVLDTEQSISNFVNDGELPDPGLTSVKVTKLMCTKVGREIPKRIGPREHPRWCPIAK